MICLGDLRFLRKCKSIVNCNDIKLSGTLEESLIEFNLSIPRENQYLNARTFSTREAWVSYIFSHFTLLQAGAKISHEP
jgi:hypothetical protein